MTKFCFAVIPDVHLGREKVNIHFWDRESEKEAVVGIEIEKKLKKAIDLINQDRKIEFTILIGDLTDSGLPEQFKIARNILDRLKKPYIPLMGNHDIWPYQWDWQKNKVLWNAKRPLDISEFEAYFEKSVKASWLLTETELFKSKNSLQNYSFNLGNTRFVVIDNVNRQGAPFGLPGTVAWAKLHKDSKKWLERELAITEKRRLIAFSHSPLKIRTLERLLKRSPKVKEIINISGHRHKITERRRKVITVVTTNALYLKPSFLKVLISKKVQFQHQNL